jgi:hypothetical protein
MREGGEGKDEGFLREIPALVMKEGGRSVLGRRRPGLGRVSCRCRCDKWRWGVRCPPALESEEDDVPVHL